MPKLVTPLTDAQIRAAKATGKRYRLHDGKGLYLDVSPKGDKRWIFRYEYRSKSNMIAVCGPGGSNDYPLVSLSEARTIANGLRSLLAADIDPARRPQAATEPDAPKLATFFDVAEAWRNEKAPGWSKDTVRKVEYCLSKYVYPYIQKIPIAELTTAQVKPALVSMYEKAPELAIKARQYCNQIIEYAIQEGFREDGKLLILKGIFPRKLGGNGHYPAITKEGQLPRLVQAVNNVPTLRVRTALWLAVYTVLRPGVVVEAEWDEFDLDKREWHIPSFKMKMNFEHISPLPKQMVEKLLLWRELAPESRWVFPGQQHAKHMHRDSLSLALREQGLRGVLVPHGFRATFRTIARERLRIQTEVLEAQLAHARKDEIQAAYDRTQLLQERHEAVQAWADYLETR